MGGDVVERRDFFSMNLEKKLQWLNNWRLGTINAPLWLEETLTNLQESYGIRIQVAFEVVEIMCTEDMLEEQAFEEYLKRVHRRKVGMFD
jgi:hypothetical protein